MRRPSHLKWLAAPLLALAVAGSPAAAAPNLDTRLGIAEGFRNPGVMADTHAGWERLILPWDQVQPGGADDFSHLGITISDQQLKAELDRGEHVVGLLEFTPGWAAANPDQGMRSPPINLDRPFDDPSNYWGRFVSETARHYAGRIDDWVLWNEPEFHPGDPGAGGSFTWLGSDEQFAQLLKVGYLAIKKANPNAHVSFPGTSYWVDLLNNRPQFYDRLMGVLTQDPDAAANNYYHDVVGLNLYRAPDDVYRVYSIIKDIQRKYGIDKPVWLTETNAMPSDDRAVACPHADTAIQTTMDQQAAYAVQAFAMAAAAGYQRFEFYQMVDQNPCAEPAVWGATRDDGSRRPVSAALQTAIGQFAGYIGVHLVPLVRETQDWSPWPEDPSSLMPNWQVYQVAFDKPGNQRVTAVWNGDGSPLRVRIRKNGSSASLIDRNGASHQVQDAQGWWVLDLAPATAHFPQDPDGYHFIGGEPMLLVEDGVDPSAPVVAPALGDPGSVPREFRLFPSPRDGQTVSQGQSADYFISVRGYEGFDDPVTFTLDHWSTQRVPRPQDPSTLPLGLTLPESVMPGQTAMVHLETAGADPGIYFIDVRANGGGISKTIQIALVVD
ncbi:MAG: hypothetical protein E6I52_19130 [Chloroflexi bacterium]|nr:MAG: hypothetical protein E6I52_19130 [Chloroflexota bacterium]